MTCNSEDLALKSFFLGPQAENSRWVQGQIDGLLKDWFEWRKGFCPEDGIAISDRDMDTAQYRDRMDHTARVLRELSALFEREIPKFSPRYIGHMFSEISLPALLGHILTVLHNPNNISYESSVVGTKIENESLAALGEMMGMATSIGHFTSGGTVANFEAVHRARFRFFSWLAIGLGAGGMSAFESGSLGWERANRLRQDLSMEEIRSWSFYDVDPFSLARKMELKLGRAFRSPVILVPEHKHYSWVKSVHLLGLGAESLWPVSLSSKGQLCLRSLDILIKKAAAEDRPIQLVVSVLGTTELGMIDPIHQVQTLLDQYANEYGWHIWHHVDAAYGGFFSSLLGADKKMEALFSNNTIEALRAVSRVDSVTLDPHKLGYVPYASGAFICRERRNYYQRPFGGPYVDFNLETDRGPFTIEGSRSATGAVATWMTAKCIGLNQNGYGRIIARTVLLRQELEQKIKDIPSLRLVPHTETNLLGFCLANDGERLSVSNSRTVELFKKLNLSGSQFFVSKTILNRRNYRSYFDEFVVGWGAAVDTEDLYLIRLCIMNPFFKTTEMQESILDKFVRALREKSLEV